MNTIRSALGLASPSAPRTIALRAVAFAIAIWGMKSSLEMAFWAKLMLAYSLDMWDFNENTLGFFINYASIVGLYATLTHYTLSLFGTVRARGMEDRQRLTERYDR
ncbi:MAG: hypothetical protein ACT6U0_23900 [Shinella sp.]|uniref:hypothetical protein n=1 Tax=Shinella sp. TaxID=1870904 RepID=UPI004035CD84